MKKSSRFTVAVHTLTLLALEKRPLSSTYIAFSVNTNPVVIRRILGSLNDVGLITTKLGSEGGADLARSPDRITMLDVYRATEGNDLFSLHSSKPNPFCPCGNNIQPLLTDVFEKAKSAMEAVLAETTIADIAKGIEDRFGKPYQGYDSYLKGEVSQ